MENMDRLDGWPADIQECEILTIVKLYVGVVFSLARTLGFRNVS